MTSRIPINKKIILITGVTSGIGKAFVELNKSTTDYFIVGIGRGTEHPQYDGFKYIRADLSNDQDIKKITEFINRIGRVDILINNAGLGYKGTIEDLPVEEIQKQIRVNFITPILLIKDVLPLMRKRRSGHIINICSIGAFTLTPTFGYYAISKSMLFAASEILRQETSEWNIKISVIIPGAVKTGFGKKIIQYSNETAYSKLYTEWNRKFRNYFKKSNSATDIALIIMSTIKHPKDIVTCMFRERLILFLNKIFPRKSFYAYLRRIIYYD
jgi:short-subunit dehydrogenase